MDFISVTLPMPPTHNNSLIPIKRGRHSTMVMSEAARLWFAQADAILAPLHGVFSHYLTEEVGVFVELYFNSKRRDADSATKKCLDAMQNHIYANDRQVRFQASAPFSQDEEGEEYVVVRVWEIGKCPDHVRNLIGGYM